LLSLDSNSLALYAIPPPKKSVEPTAAVTTTLSLPGHPTEIRTLAVSSDNEMLLSAGPGQAKVWNVRTGNVIRSWTCGFALCSAFLPGDKIVVLGTKEGELELFDLPSSESVDVVKAHGGTVWSLQVASDGTGMVSGSSDKSVKFWNVQVVAEQVLDSEVIHFPPLHLRIVTDTGQTTVSKLRLQHTHTLKLNEDVLSVVLTPDSNLLCVALLDCTIKVFFTKTLKHHLTLYGHTSPGTNLSISLDSKLLLSVSQDRTAKLWGLDFGDLHRSVRAHSSAVLAGMFERGTDERDWHNFWTVGRDGGVRYWDGNTWERILEVKKEGAEIWTVEGDSRGDWVVVAGRDKAIRIWERVDEQVFLEEEREKEIEANYDEDLVEGFERTRVDDEEGEGEVVQPGKATVETLNAGERIIEALELAREDREMVQQYARGKKHALVRNPIFVAYGGVSAERYVLSVLEKVKPTALQDALLVLPFEHVEILITFIAQWAQNVQLHILEREVPFFSSCIQFASLTSGMEH
jgi:U3 small nucleolar RNA-associated protein 12